MKAQKGRDVKLNRRPQYVGSNATWREVALAAEVVEKPLNPNFEAFLGP